MVELTRLNVNYKAVEEQIAAWIDAGGYQEALSGIVGGVSHFYTSPYVVGQTLFLSGFDSLMAELGHRLCASQEAWTPGSSHMFILSEFYNGGGHSLVVRDLVEALGGAVVVLTDLFRSYAKSEMQVDDAKVRMPSAVVHVLREGLYIDKVKELQAVFRAVRPGTVSFITHQPDVIPYVAAASLPLGVRKIFVHHADHHPSLGGTLKGYAHVDFTRHIGHICTNTLGAESIHLPMYVQDRGLKTFSTPIPGAPNIVSAGHQHKYTYEGEFAYQKVIAEILSSLEGHFWHIGGMEPKTVENIYACLKERGIDAARFTYIPPVASLWDTLKELDAHVYLGSFPIPGGRGSVEAQGCGYPIVYYTAEEQPPLLRHADMFADPELGWRSIPELIDKLKAVCEGHGRRVAQARALYERDYSYEVYRRALASIYGV